MSITRSLGILVTFGIPAIIVPGVTWEFTSSWPAVYVSLIVLGFVALGFIDMARK